MKKFGISLTLLLSLSLLTAHAQDSSMQEAMDEAKRIPEGTNVGEVSADFSVRDINGKTTSSKDSRRQGAMVIVFYQGTWNGEDVQFLINLNDSLAVLQDLDAQVLALTTEQPEYIKMLNKKREMGFTLAHDHSGRVSKAFDVLYYVDETYCKQLMQKGNINLHERYGSEVVTMSAPSVFVVAKSGKILFSQMDFSSGNRPYISEIAHAIASPGEQRITEPVLEETGGEPIKEKRRKKKKKK